MFPSTRRVKMLTRRYVSMLCASLETLHDGFQNGLSDTIEPCSMVGRFQDSWHNYYRILGTMLGSRRIPIELVVVWLTKKPHCCSNSIVYEVSEVSVAELVYKPRIRPG